MNKVMKQIALPASSVGYSHPSVRIINLGLKHSVLLSGSDTTKDGFMEDENVF